jgi:hypothetical protein
VIPASHAVDSKQRQLVAQSIIERMDRRSTVARARQWLAVGNPNALKSRERGDRPGEGLVGEKPPPKLDGGRWPETLMVWELGERR